MNKGRFTQVVTADGSSTLLNQDLGVTYHSTHGAVSESIHVFIRQGLEYCVGQSGGAPIVITEVGMGTGLNVLLTYLHAVETGQQIHYQAIEPCLLDLTLVQKLNYPNFLGQPALEEVQKSLFEQSGNTVRLSPNFTFCLLNQSFEGSKKRARSHLIYLDAFAPSTQPEMWSTSFLKQISAWMYPEIGVVVTFCAQGQFKRNLKQSGFVVETLPGPPGKREMVRATLQKQVG